MYDRKKRFIKFNDTQETMFNNPSDGLMELLLNSNNDINLFFPVVLGSIVTD